VSVKDRLRPADLETTGTDDRDSVIDGEELVEGRDCIRRVADGVACRDLELAAKYAAGIIDASLGCLSPRERVRSDARVLAGEWM
jgi:hypothetical protein